MKLGELGEDAFLRELAGRLGSRSKKVPLGVGDDAAALALPDGERALVSTDALVEGVHFNRSTLPPRFLGRRAVAVAASDIAAMGGELHAVLLSLVVPSELEVGALWQIVEGAGERAGELGGALVGGNLAESSGPVIVDVTVIGASSSKRLLRRSGAREGDGVYVSGKIGASATGLELLRRGAALDPGGALVVPSALRGGPISLAEGAIRAHIDPEPRLELGVALSRRKLATACIDISDGLGVDLSRLCDASGTAAHIEESQLPLAPSLLGWEREWGREPFTRALGAGEDYELLFTVRNEAKLQSLRETSPVPVTRIGVIRPAGEEAGERPRGTVAIERRDGSVEAFDRSSSGMGWDHFGTGATT